MWIWFLVQFNIHPYLCIGKLAAEARCFIRLRGNSFEKTIGGAVFLHQQVHMSGFHSFVILAVFHAQRIDPIIYWVLKNSDILIQKCIFHLLVGISFITMLSI